MRKPPSWVRQVISITALTLVVLFAARACSIDAAEVEVRFRLGRDHKKVALIEAHLFNAEGEPLSSASINTKETPTTTVGAWRIPSLAKGEYRLDIRMKGGDGTVVNLERTLTVASDRSVIEVALQNSLGPLALE